MANGEAEPLANDYPDLASYGAPHFQPVDLRFHGDDAAPGRPMGLGRDESRGGQACIRSEPT
jgi:hypothetical protein